MKQKYLLDTCICAYWVSVSDYMPCICKAK